MAATSPKEDSRLSPSARSSSGEPEASPGDQHLSESSHDSLVDMMSSTTRGAPDSRARDIRRRVDVIQKKLADLQELGVPCAFCYSSVRNTGSLFTLGDKRMTDVMEAHKNEILKNLMDTSFDCSEMVSKEIHLILPPLPAPLDQLSRNAMQSHIVGILKDLGLRWSDPKPKWWPLEVPFVSPRSVPDNFSGSWTQALKKVIESVYSYFSYDVHSYVTGNLNSLKDRELEARSRRQDEVDPDSQMEEAFEKTPTASAAGVSLAPQTTTATASITKLSMVQKMAGKKKQNGAKAKLPEMDRLGEDPASSDPVPSSPKTTQHHHHSQRVSSFTVENILMGSATPSASTGDSIVSPSLSHSGVSSLSHSSSSPLGPQTLTTWHHVTHPQVKYTKFTLLSPASMSGERKRSLNSVSVDSEDMPTYKHKREKRLTELNETDLSQQVHGLATQLVCQDSLVSKANTVKDNSKTLSESDTQTACNALLSLGREAVNSQKVTAKTTSPTAISPTSDGAEESPKTLQTVIRTTAAGTPENFALPINSVHQIDPTSYTFPPSHRYILVLPPPQCVAINPAVQTTTEPTKNQPISPIPIPTVPVTKGEELPPTSSTTPVPTHLTENNVKPSQWGYVPIAPKSEELKKQELSALRPRRREANSKPRKLRFHMTNIVQQAKRRSSIEGGRGGGRGRGGGGGGGGRGGGGGGGGRAVAVPPSAYAGRNESGDIDERECNKEEEEEEEEEEDQIDSEESPSALSVLDPSNTERKGYDHETLSEHDSAVEPQTKVLKDYLQLTKHQSMDGKPSQRGAIPRTTTRGRGRGRRGYTRRKRELTFHLYESPTATVRSRRSHRGGRGH